MRYRIIIHDEVKTLGDAEYLLKEIARQMNQGYTSGRSGPTWDFEAVDGQDSSPDKAGNENGGQDEEKVDEEESGSPEGNLEATEGLES